MAKTLVLTVVLLLVCAAAPATEFTNLSGPYLGQTPPGTAPRIFAPGVVSVAANFEHSAAVFSPDGTELFWCTVVDRYTSGAGDWVQHLYTMKLVDGYWTAPMRAEFTLHLNTPISRPVFSPDGNHLYIEHFSNPAVESHTDIFVSERTANGWSIPEPVSPLVNSAAVERLHCVTADGSLIFSRDPMTPREGVYISRRVAGQFTEPEQLGAPFDSSSREFAIVLSRDESFMLVAVSHTGAEDELYISYREPDGSWTERVRTPYECGGFLALSPDEEYLFFLQDGIFWADTSFVENLKPAHLR